MNKEGRDVIAFGFVVACFAALLGAAILSVIVDPVWSNGYYSVYEMGSGEPGVDDWWRYIFSSDSLSTKIVPYRHTFECYGHSCFNPTGDGLTISDSVITLYLYGDRPHFIADIHKFCYYDDNPNHDATPNWRNDYLFFAVSPTYNVTIYDKDGNVIWQGGDKFEDYFTTIEPPVAVAIYNGKMTIAVAYDALQGADIQAGGGVLTMTDRNCEPGGASYHVTAYYALEYGNHPELAYDVYCMAFGGCTPTQPQQPSYPEWNIDWELVLLILILLVILLVIL